MQLLKIVFENQTLFFQNYRLRFFQKDLKQKKERSLKTLFCWFFASSLDAFSSKLFCCPFEGKSLVLFFFAKLIKFNASSRSKQLTSFIMECLFFWLPIFLSYKSIKNHLCYPYNTNLDMSVTFEHRNPSSIVSKEKNCSFNFLRIFDCVLCKLIFEQRAPYKALKWTKFHSTL